MTHVRRVGICDPRLRTAIRLESTEHSGNAGPVALPNDPGAIDVAHSFVPLPSDSAAGSWRISANAVWFIVQLATVESLAPSRNDSTKQKEKPRHSPRLPADAGLRP
ncbi:MAG: hypothetical protein RET84_22880, partial [Pseudomonadota bacterium]|nr:hypothetical protein [Pseudomonadota bacterium]